MGVAEPPIRVVIVDPHAISRAGLRAVVEAGGLTVVETLGEGVPVAEVCARSLPEVALVDPVLPDITGADVVRGIGGRTPGVAVIVLADAVDGPLAREVLAAGARGYLLKTIDAEGLVSAIRAAVDGRSCIDPRAAAVLAAPRSQWSAPLSPREREVLRLVASGMTNKVIAKELEISDGTVRVYLSEILTKLGAANRTEAAMVAVRRGLVSLSEQRRPGRG